MKRAKTIGLPVITMATKIDTVLAFKSGCFLAAHELSVKTYNRKLDGFWYQLKGDKKKGEFFNFSSKSNRNAPLRF